MCPPSSKLHSAAIRASRLFQFNAVQQSHLHCLHSNCFWHKPTDQVSCFDCVFALDIQLVRRDYQQTTIHSACLSRSPVIIKCSQCNQSLTTVQSGTDCWSCREAYLNFVSSIPADEINDFYNGPELPGIITRNHQSG